MPMPLNRKFIESNIVFILPVEQTIYELLTGYDTDGDKKITIDDAPLTDYFMVSTTGDTVILRNTYYISNLLQELAIARDARKDDLTISLSQVQEPPAERITRRIRDCFWDELTRTIDAAGIDRILSDDKMQGKEQRIYVPFNDQDAIEYWKKVKADRPALDVIILPEIITPEYVKSVDVAPGILSLKIVNSKGVPFVVPGGRFNEMYGWDSYFEGIGLLVDNRIDLAKAMVDNFCYQVEHYGKILNANRSYYLTRTQPPFLTSFIREVFDKMEEKDFQWLAECTATAIKEYELVWMQGNRYTPETKLNRFYAEGSGIPPETEPGHFNEILKEYAIRYQLEVSDFEAQYSKGKIVDEELDQYFIHDHTMRESGHDTTWRLDNMAADLNCTDLNAMLYKYETDFEFIVATYFNGKLEANGKTYNASQFASKANIRKDQMKKYLWDEETQGFYDYNIKTGKRIDFTSATNFFPLWANICTKEEAAAMVPQLMHKLKAQGGILGSDKESVDRVANNKVQRQWDYPNGWAPHQMLLWKGLLNYGYEIEAREMIYRWLFTITQNAVDYNGTIPEKYNVVDSTHKVDAEYGNVGTDFAYITKSGFGWMNASYQYGLSLLSPEYIQKLDNLEKPNAVFAESL